MKRVWLCGTWNAMDSWNGPRSYTHRPRSYIVCREDYQWRQVGKCRDAQTYGINGLSLLRQWRCSWTCLYELETTDGLSVLLFNDVRIDSGGTLNFSSAAACVNVEPYRPTVTVWRHHHWHCWLCSYCHNNSFSYAPSFLQVIHSTSPFHESIPWVHSTGPFHESIPFLDVPHFTHYLYTQRLFILHTYK